MHNFHMSFTSTRSCKQSYNYLLHHVSYKSSFSFFMALEISPFPLSGYSTFASLSDVRSFYCRKRHCQQLRLRRQDTHSSIIYSKISKMCKAQGKRLKSLKLPHRFPLPSFAFDYKASKFFVLLKNLSVM